MGARVRKFSLLSFSGLMFGIAVLLEGLPVYGIVDSAVQVTVLSVQVARELSLLRASSESVQV